MKIGKLIVIGVIIYGLYKFFTFQIGDYMKNLKFDHIAFFSICIFLSLQALTDDNPEENDRLAAFLAEEASGTNNIMGQQCEDYIAGKGWNKGTNTKSDGSPYFIAVGIVVCLIEIKELRLSFV